MKPAVVWFRQDLRVADNAALHHAVNNGGPVYPVYIWAPHEEGEWPVGEASRSWLHHSLESLERALQALGLQLIIRSGDSLTELARVLQETKSSEICWNTRYEPVTIQRDGEIKGKLEQVGVLVNTFSGSLLREPMRVATHKKQPYTDFASYWKKFTRLGEIALPLDPPDALAIKAKSLLSLSVDDLGLLSNKTRVSGLAKFWNIGCEHAADNLELFIDKAIDRYETDRHIPGVNGTSRLSPHLHFGEISPRQIWHAVRSACYGELTHSNDATAYLRELGWREFAYNLLYHFPYATKQPLKDNYADFPWINDQSQLLAWQRGKTGYPIVDAGMRQLWKTGWMHNRVRMIAASFLVKDLLIDWKKGASWFWDTLVDADLASNTLGWQWVSGCGADAAPYFKIFNPISQGEKYDPEGKYVKQWIPEIAALPRKYVHRPWDAEESVLAEANLKLGEDYPCPIIDHGEARQRALAVHSEHTNCEIFLDQT